MAAEGSGMTYNSRARRSALLVAGAVLVVAFQLAMPATGLAPRPAPATPPGSVPVERPSPTPGDLSGSTSRITPSHPPAFRPAAGGGVNLTRIYSREPAPMGVADYGVDAAGTPTDIATPVLVGIASLGTTVAWNGSLVSPWSVNFELGGNLQFTVGNATYVYWVQDVLQYSTRGGNAAFFDDVWNASAPGAQMQSGTIVGAGGLTSSVAGEYYDCPANSSLPGNGYFIPLPAQIEVEMTAVLVSGAPGVTFAFNDGFGWLPFDTLSFPFATGADDSGFVIDGSAYRPDGRYLDAEFALGGPAIGSQTHVNSSVLALELEYWNGHNLQEPTTAYNFASDSTESVGNVRAAGATGPNNGTLLANVTAGPGGALTTLWNRSDVGEVNVSSSIVDGELYLDGVPEGGFAGAAANLTLAPGTYTLAIYNQSLLEGEATVSVAAGSYQFVHIAWQDVFTVTFQASGLPPAAAWSVLVDGVSLGGSSSTISCIVPVGEHSYRVAPLAGFVASPASGELPITDANVTVAITWTVQTFLLSFVALGLPSGTPWTVTVNGVPHSAVGASIAAAEPAGTYAYAVSPLPGFRPNPSVGSVEIADRNATVNVTWAAFTYPVAFAASGLPAGRAWTLAVESHGIWLNSTGTSPVVSLPLANGTFSYVVGPPSGYESTPPSGQAAVNGSGLTVYLVFRGANGFLAGTVGPGSAELWVDNVSVPLVNGGFNLSVTPGPHDVRASAPGYATIELVLEVLSDQVTPVDWNLTANPTAAGWSVFLPYVVGAGLAVAVIAAAVWWLRRPPRLRVIEAEVIEEPSTR